MENKMVKQFSLTKLMLALAITLQFSGVYAVFGDFLRSKETIFERDLEICFQSDACRKRYELLRHHENNEFLIFASLHTASSNVYISPEELKQLYIKETSTKQDKTKIIQKVRGLIQYVQEIIKEDDTEQAKLAEKTYRNIPKEQRLN